MSNEWNMSWDNWNQFQSGARMPETSQHTSHNYREASTYQAPVPHPQTSQWNVPGAAAPEPSYVPGQQFMADPVFKAAQHFGEQFAEQQKEKLTKYINGFNLKYYFAVDNGYVGKKIGILLFPFLRKEWSPAFTNNDKPSPARDDVNAPDLYIPLMSFITYILVSAFVLGTQGRFSPEQLGMLTTNACVWVIIENVIIFVSKYLMNIAESMSIWHSLAYSTYKFMGVILCLTMFLIGGKVGYYCTFFYTAISLSVFLLQSVKNAVYNSHHFSGDDGRNRKLMLIIFILVSQPLIMWWLTNGVTSFEYYRFDFAQMALNKIGMSDRGPPPAVAANSPIPMSE